jgi:hypothetical protein
MVVPTSKDELIQFIEEHMLFSGKNEFEFYYGD